MFRWTGGDRLETCWKTPHRSRLYDVYRHSSFGSALPALYEMTRWSSFDPCGLKGGVKASLRCGGTAGSLCEKGWSFSVQSCLLPLSNLCDQNTYHPLCSVCFLPGRMYGADDFLPMLTYVVAQCDMPQLDTEIQYMMELLDPSLLQGEGRSCRFDPWPLAIYSEQNLTA